MKTATVRIYRTVQHVYRVEVTTDRDLTDAEIIEFATTKQGKDVQGVSVTEEQELGYLQDVVDEQQEVLRIEVTK